MARGIRVLFAGLALAAIGLTASTVPAFACSTYGRTFDDVVATSTLIVEADVTGVSSGGRIRLSAREVFFGSMPNGGLVGTVPVLQNSECSARVRLEVGDHVVLAFVDPGTAYGAETVVWWVERDGTIERTSIVEDTDTTTIATVRAALRARLPDTSTTPEIVAPVANRPEAWPGAPLALVVLVAFVMRLWPVTPDRRRSAQGSDPGRQPLD